jgi:hypothetical protein
MRVGISLPFFLCIPSVPAFRQVAERASATQLAMHLRRTCPDLKVLYISAYDPDEFLENKRQ